ncbi:MAG: hypothetical protein AAFN63_18315 [Pseudomonadota bacterium]
MEFFDLTELGKKTGSLKVGEDQDDIDIIQVRVVKDRRDLINDIFTLFGVTLFATIVGGCFVSWVFLSL